MSFFKESPKDTVRRLSDPWCFVTIVRSPDGIDVLSPSMILGVNKSFIDIPIYNSNKQALKNVIVDCNTEKKRDANNYGVHWMPINTICFFHKL